MLTSAPVEGFTVQDEVGYTFTTTNLLEQVVLLKLTLVITELERAATKQVSDSACKKIKGSKNWRFK